MLLVGRWSLVVGLWSFWRLKELLRLSFLLKTFFTFRKDSFNDKNHNYNDGILRHCSVLEEVSLLFMQKGTIL